MQGSDSCFPWDFCLGAQGCQETSETPPGHFSANHANGGHCRSGSSRIQQDRNPFCYLMLQTKGTLAVLLRTSLLAVSSWGTGQRGGLLLTCSCCVWLVTCLRNTGATLPSATPGFQLSFLLTLGFPVDPEL